MDLKEFKKLNKIYSKLPLPKEIWNTPKYEEYIQAFHNNKECQEYELKRRIKEAGINYKKYCCLKMASNLIEPRKPKPKNEEEIHNESIITHYKKGKVLGIRIQDGGNAFIQINYCPWCGQNLKRFTNR